MSGSNTKRDHLDSAGQLDDPVLRVRDHLRLIEHDPDLGKVVIAEHHECGDAGAAKALVGELEPPRGTRAGSLDESLVDHARRIVQRLHLRCGLWITPW